MPPSLSKSRFVAGWQCVRQLWWRVHDPDAPELQPDAVLQDRFDQGAQVGRRAREEFPGGVLIDLPHRDPGQVPATRAAIAAGAPAVFEAAFLEDGVFAAVDVLLRDGEGWAVIEVKSSTCVKDEHIPDAAVQVWVARRAGLDVRRVEIMHLNPDHRHPAEEPLFLRSDVTEVVERFLPQVPGLVTDLLAALQGPLPSVPTGLHCFEPRVCPFFDRCWPGDRDHIRHLYGTGGAKVVGWMQRGVHRIGDLLPAAKLNETQRRQVRAVREDRLVVESGLAEALAGHGLLERGGRVGYLDFETIQRALPVWSGQRPWEQTVVQFSYHEQQPDGAVTHAAFLAEGPDDPRAEIVEGLLAATAGAPVIVTYTPFEKTRIRKLAEQVPARRNELLELADRLVDLLPVVRNHVYHPEFRGSYSLKAILTPLCPDLGYDDLAIVDGQVASVEIARLLFFQHLVQDRARTRADLLAYCERDTWALVRLVARLRELAGAAPA
jgi:predicted RecB family nuclease